MLIVFDEPSDLLRTSWMPAHSSTARTGPPAITPVPADAGRSRTTPAGGLPLPGGGGDTGNAEEVLLRLLDALRDRGGDFTGLAVADTHQTVAVADDHESGEAEAT